MGCSGLVSFVYYSLFLMAMINGIVIGVEQSKDYDFSQWLIQNKCEPDPLRGEILNKVFCNTPMDQMYNSLVYLVITSGYCGFYWIFSALMLMGLPFSLPVYYYLRMNNPEFNLGLNLDFADGIQNYMYAVYPL